LGSVDTAMATDPWRGYLLRVDAGDASTLPGRIQYQHQSIQKPTSTSPSSRPTQSLSYHTQTTTPSSPRPQQQRHHPSSYTSSDLRLAVSPSHSPFTPHQQTTHTFPRHPILIPRPLPPLPEPTPLLPSQQRVAYPAFLRPIRLFAGAVTTVPVSVIQGYIAATSDVRIEETERGCMRKESRAVGETLGVNAWTNWRRRISDIGAKQTHTKSSYSRVRSGDH
jgi:hypothetical protein